MSAGWALSALDSSVLRSRPLLSFLLILWEKMGHYDMVFGPLLICGFINCGLFSFETVQVAYYYQNYRKDHLIFKIVVAMAYLVDLTTTISACACVYLYTVVFWGNPQALLKLYWPISAGVILTQVSALIVQLFLIHRYSKLHRNWFVILPLIIMGVAAFALSLHGSIFFSVHPNIYDRHMMKSLASTCIALRTATDIGIAAALVAQLRRVMFSFENGNKIHFRRMIAGTIETGISGSMLSLTAAIIFAVNPLSTVPTSIIFCVGRVYTITMLRNLNIRSNSKDKFEHSRNRLSGNGRTSTILPVSTQSAARESVHIQLQDANNKFPVGGVIKVIKPITHIVTQDDGAAIATKPYSDARSASATGSSHLHRSQSIASSSSDNIDGTATLLASPTIQSTPSALSNEAPGQFKVEGSENANGNDSEA